MNFAMTIWLLVVLAIFVAIPVLVGVYVWRDASRRGMNAPLWTLVAALAPAFIGLIIYLLVRGSWPDLRCPACGEPLRGIIYRHLFQKERGCYCSGCGQYIGIEK